MWRFLKKHKLLYILPIAFGLYNLAFEDFSIFWYMYTFSLLLLMLAGVLFSEVKDQLPTWKSLIYGGIAAVIICLVLVAGYYVFQLSGIDTAKTTARFLSVFMPTSIWHFLLLMFIIVPGEELFWRGFVQQQLQLYMPASFAILIASLLFGLTFWLAGFWPGILAGIVVGVCLGYLYEKKKSMPLLIVTHLLLIVLLLFIFPILKL